MERKRNRKGLASHWPLILVICLGVAVTCSVVSVNMSLWRKQRQRITFNKNLLKSVGGGQAETTNDYHIDGKEMLPKPPSTYFDSIAWLFESLEGWESEFGTKPVGDDGDSKGHYHIKRCFWQDGCEEGGVDWDYDELVWSKPHSEQVMMWYWERYNCRTNEERARRFWGGPKGMEKDWTAARWQEFCFVYKPRRI